MDREGGFGGGGGAPPDRFGGGADIPNTDMVRMLEAMNLLVQRQQVE